MGDDRYRCPECDGPVSYSGEYCAACKAKPPIVHVSDINNPRLVYVTPQRAPLAAFEIREALLSIAADIDPGRNVTSAQFENRTLALALKLVANADDTILHKLGALLK